MSKTIVYTLRTCPACLKLKRDWAGQGIEFEERQVDDNQAWLDEAVKLGDQVPVILYEDGRVEVGYLNMIS
ncbi:MAG: Glutaredoxin protein [Dehalococcoidia bacterium]|nr:Glutaredoxin protein [Dehalococcoidia bacterium]